MVDYGAGLTAGSLSQSFREKILKAPRLERKNDDNHRDFCECFTKFVNFMIQKLKFATVSRKNSRITI